MNTEPTRELPTSDQGGNAPANLRNKALVETLTWSASAKPFADAAPSSSLNFPPLESTAPGQAFPGYLKPGQCVHDFELLRLLGEGSFGQVFLARQLSLDRQVALKVTSN